MINETRFMTAISTTNMFAVELEVPLETAQILTYNLLFIFHRFLELKTYRSMFTNETTIIASTLRNNPAYVSIYLTWMKIIIIEAIPYISILTLNICILKNVYNASKYRQSFRQAIRRLKVTDTFHKLFG